jgi:hypothetical protein
MRQGEQQVLAEVLAHEEGTFLRARRAQEGALAGERSESVEAAGGAPDAGDALAPVAADSEGRGGPGDQGQAEPTVRGGVALLVGDLEVRKTEAEERPLGVGSEGRRRAPPEGQRAAERVEGAPAPGVAGNATSAAMIRTGKSYPAPPWFPTPFVPGNSQAGSANLNLPLPRSHTTKLCSTMKMHRRRPLTMA